MKYYNHTTLQGLNNFKPPHIAELLSYTETNGGYRSCALPHHALQRLDESFATLPHETREDKDGKFIFLPTESAERFVAKRQALLGLQELNYFTYAGDSSMQTRSCATWLKGNRCLMEDPKGFFEAELTKLGIPCSRAEAIQHQHAALRAETGLDTASDYSFDRSIIVHLGSLSEPDTQRQLKVRCKQLAVSNPYTESSMQPAYQLITKDAPLPVIHGNAAHEGQGIAGEASPKMVSAIWL